MAKLPAILFCGMALLLLASCGEQPASERATEAEVAQEVDLPIPPSPPLDFDSGPHPFPRREEPQPTFDPLQVRNIDVMESSRRKYIEVLRIRPDGMPEGLEIDGIVETTHDVPVMSGGRPLLDIHGNPVYERRTVLEYSFKDHKRPYRAGERVEGTDWRIPDDWQLEPHPSEPIERWDSGRKATPRSPVPPGYMPPAVPEPK